jgi:pimeloyl-ACP methyl ester carboxylesterase
LTKKQIEKQEFVLDEYVHRCLAIKHSTNAAWIIGFNGFGRSALDLLEFFQRLELDLHFNILAIENPYHGGEQSADPILHPITKNHLEKALNSFRKAFGIESYHLFGYSMGGKIVGNLLTLESVQPKSAILLGSEGYEKRAFYLFLSTKNYLLRFARFVIANPGLLLWTIKTLGRLRVIRKDLAVFLGQQISDEYKRTLIFNTWCSLRHVQDTFKKIRSDNSVIAIYGKYDPVIRYKKLKKSLIKAELKSLSFHEIKTGHSLLKNKLSSELKNILNEKTLA